MKLVDSSCIICLFKEINKPFILMDWCKRNHEIVLTTQVYTELQKNIETKNKIKPEIDKGNIQIKNTTEPDKIDVLSNRYPFLGRGEISIIQTAIELNKQNIKYYAVLDDNNARKVAKKFNVNLTGTYGLLKLLKEKNCINEIDFETCKNDMDKSNFRINFGKIE